MLVTVPLYSMRGDEVQSQQRPPQNLRPGGGGLTGVKGPHHGVKGHICRCKEGSHQKWLGIGAHRYILLFVLCPKCQRLDT